MLHALQHAQILSRFLNPVIRGTGRGLHCLADEEGTLFGRAGQEVPEFGDCLRNPRDLAKNWIAVELHNFENFFEKVKQFNALSSGFPTVEITLNTSESSVHNSWEN
jgi:hypothetical protein